MNTVLPCLSLFLCFATAFLPLPFHVGKMRYATVKRDFKVTLKGPDGSEMVRQHYNVETRRHVH